MIEKPLERLNYFNGQRLEASDLKTEQDYHIRVRRWLNKSLYSAGIADGLEVRSAGAGRYVIVSPGLALDSIGREIILLEEEPVEIFSYAGTDASTVEGNYLVVEYFEEKTAYEKSSGCVVRHNGSNGGSCGSIPDGPSRVQSKVKFSSVRFPPPPGSNQVALARIELTDDCSNIGQIDAAIRRYIGPASQAKVRQFALEGEREVAFLPKSLFPAPALTALDTRVDVVVVGRIYFHIRGRQPNSVTLYLRGDQFSSLHYTELGEHSHAATLSGAIGSHTIDATALSHAHSAGTLITRIEKQDDTDPEVIDDGATHDFKPHQHYLFGRIGVPDIFAPHLPGHRMAFALHWNGSTEQVIDNDVGLEIRWGRHRHEIDGKTSGPEDFTSIELSHDGLSTSGSTDEVGVDSPARSGARLLFANDLQVSIGPAGRVLNRTDDIRQQLAANRPDLWLDNASNPKPLGDGASNHEFVVNGTGPIRLDFLTDSVFVEGEYCIELSLPAGANEPNGGKLLYNLYIE